MYVNAPYVAEKIKKIKNFNNLFAFLHFEILLMDIYM